MKLPRGRRNLTGIWVESITSLPALETFMACHSVFPVSYLIIFFTIFSNCLADMRFIIIGKNEIICHQIIKRQILMIKNQHIPSAIRTDVVSNIGL